MRRCIYCKHAALPCDRCAAVYAEQVITQPIAPVSTTRRCPACSTPLKVSETRRCQACAEAGIEPLALF